MRFDIRERRRGPASSRLLAWCLGGALLGAPLGAQDQAPLLAAGDSAGRSLGVLRSGDQLKVTVFKNPELSGDYVIDSRGLLTIPGLGVIRAAGLQPGQAEGRLREALVQRGFTNPEIAVLLLIRLSVLGEVQRPGLYPVEPGVNLLELLTVAGGPLPSAALDRTRVIREGRVFKVDLEAALAGSAAGQVILNSNDVVVVPKRTGFTRENLQLGIGIATAMLTLAGLIATLNR